MVAPSDHHFPAARRIVAYVALALVGATLLAQVSLWLAVLVAVLALAPLLVIAIRATRARLGVVRPDFATDPAYPARAREFETLPFENPFAPASAHLPLERRITMAAEASALYSRGVSVLFLVAEDDDEAQRAGATLRDALRPSDHVELIEGGVVACLNLVRDLANVDDVIARLSRRLLENGWPQSNPPRFGRALYPMHGYTGEDLIAAARSQAWPAARSARASARRVDPPAAARETPPKARRRKPGGALRS